MKECAQYTSVQHSVSRELHGGQNIAIILFTICDEYDIISWLKMLKTSIKNFVTIVKKKYEIWSLNGKWSSEVLFSTYKYLRKGTKKKKLIKSP